MFVVTGCDYVKAEQDDNNNVSEFVTGCNCVKAERDDNNNVSELDVPPVVPHELLKVVP